jgi:hypothetical protein
VRLDNDPATRPLILDAQWDELYSLIMQRMKRYEQFAAWRAEETAAPAIVIGPEFFQVRDQANSGEGLEWTPRLWRSDGNVRQRFERTLKARIKDKDALDSELATVLDDIEGDVLVEVRNELVRSYVYPRLITTDQLNELTERFQIDCAEGSCRKTTRVAQAFETIQGLLFDVRNGLLDLGHWSLSADHFDEEWRWIGSYASWRSALQVFLYPENVLRPTLRSKQRQSPGFKAFIESVQSTGAATPAAMQEAARAYEMYFSDISQLELVASVLGSGFGEAATDRNTYLFAQVKSTNRIYWTYRDPAEKQGFWTQVQFAQIDETFATINVCGAAYYAISATQRFLLLFIKTSAPEGDDLGFVKCNLGDTSSFEGLAWSTASVRTLPTLPKSSKRFLFADVAPLVGSPPRLHVWITSTDGYLVQVNARATGWMDGPFVKLPEPTGRWEPLGNSGRGGSSFSCSNNPIPARQILKGDFDGDGLDEIAVVPERIGTEGNDIWIMRYNGQLGSWEHMSPLAAVHPIQADLDCSVVGIPVKFAVVGDFDGDHTDEIALAVDLWADPRITPTLDLGQQLQRSVLASDNCFWVFKWNKGRSS